MSIEKNVLLRNPNLRHLESDMLYHLGINVANTKDTSDIQKCFGNIKFVCLGGTKERMLALAKHLLTIVPIDNECDWELNDLCASARRYSMFKVGPVLCCSHGIGMASMGVLMHELIKLMMYAKCQEPVFIRIGTSGGLGLKPGTVVVTKDTFNGYLKNEHQVAILGEKHCRPAKFDINVVNDIISCSDSNDHFEIVCANTLSAECFYEGQGRLDGASCHYTAEDKMRFLKHCHEQYGIRNMEMESTLFSSLTLHVGIRAATVCVTFLDRLLGDQVTVPAEGKGRIGTKTFNCYWQIYQEQIGTTKWTKWLPKINLFNFRSLK